MKRIFSLLICVTAMHGMANAQNENGWKVRVMPQIVWGTNNDLQRPNDDRGSRFSLPDDIGRKNSTGFSPRLEVEYNVSRHHIIATAAWVNDRFEGEARRDIVYDGVPFAEGISVDAKYKFHTYRLGYRYRLADRERFSLELGATLLLRDAYISLNSVDQKAKFTNVGVAPLLSYGIAWHASDRLSILSYGDAFGIKAGRAIDVFGGMEYRFTPLLSALAGYRLLEGGSDGDRVYTMSTFHFLSLGIGFSF